MADFSLVDIGGGGVPQPIHFPEIYIKKQSANRLFINASGDEMQGNLSMNGRKITNLKSPETALDAANKDFVVRSIKSSINGLINKVSDNSKHITEKFNQAYRHSTDLKHYVNKVLMAADRKLQQLNKTVTENRALSEINSRRISMLGRQGRVSLFETKLTSSKGISHLVLRSKETIAIIQILIETEEGAWYDINTLSPDYQFRVFIKKEKYFITCHTTLPPTWTKKLKIFSTKITR